MKLKNALKHIQEADILLFEHKPFPSFGWLVSCYSDSIFSHAALATYQKDKLYVLEFLEGQPSHMIPAEGYLGIEQKVQVFRVPDFFYIEYKNLIESLDFTPELARKITNTARRIILKTPKYGWSTIWKIFKKFMPFMRLIETDGVVKRHRHTSSFVCSTLVIHAYRQHYKDLTPFIPDVYVKPGDLSKSGLLTKILEIEN